MKVRRLVGFLIPSSFCIILVVWSCSHKTEEHAISMNQAKRDIYLIQKEALQGDTNAYNELKIVYLDYPSDNLLFWALIMAEKNDYPPAYLDVFRTIVQNYPTQSTSRDESIIIKEMDANTKALALKYLSIASTKGVIEVQNIQKNINEDKN